MSNVLSCLQERGLIESVTSEDLKKVLQQPIKVYTGFDPTADSLHIGSLVGIVMLRWFQKFGHTPVVVLGGATGRIGDPSGKSNERPLLDAGAIAFNVARIRSNFEQVLDFFHPKVRAQMFNNEEWFAGYSFIDFLRDVGKHFRVNVMLAKDSVKSRLDSEEGMSFTEFSYQLLQSYDFYHLFKNNGVVLQMGGSDQWGNIVAGIELVRKLTGQSVYGLTFPLLTKSDGKKFGKTEDGAVWLSADRYSPYEFYQYLYRVSDTDVIKLMRMLTFMDMEEIRRYEKEMGQEGYVPNTAQKRLAAEITKLMHDEEGLQAALKVTEAASPGHSGTLDPATLQAIVKDMPHVVLPSAEVVGQKFVDVALKIGLLPSKGEGVRLIGQGGAYLNNEKIDDPQLRLSQDHLIGGEFVLFAAGKKKKILIKISL